MDRPESAPPSPRKEGQVFVAPLHAAVWRRSFVILAIGWTALQAAFTVRGIHLARIKHRDFIRQVAGLACAFDVRTHVRSGGTAGEARVAVPGLRARLVSLRPTARRHAPDGWEANALETLDRPGVREVAEVVAIDKRRWLRLARPLRAEPACMKCHSGRVDRVAGLLGAISVSLPMDALALPGEDTFRHTLAAIVALWLFAVGGIWWFARRTGRQIREREEAIDRLKRAMEEIRTLTGLLPICAWCRRVRDDQGYWTQVEQYVREHTEADFTHGICPECEAKIRAELDGAGNRVPLERRLVP